MIDSNRQYYDERMNRQDYKIYNLTAMVGKMLDQIQILNCLSYKMDSLQDEDYTNMVPDNKKDPTLEGGHSTKIGGMWTLKHEIKSPKLYKLLIKTDLKG